MNAVLVVDEWYTPALLHALDGARERVDVLAFSFSIPKRTARSAPLQIAERLVDTAARGVQVRVFLEDERETSAKNRETARLLLDGGVEVVYGTGHAKGVCVDGRWVLFGSTNWTQQSLTKNTEVNVFFDEPAVAAGFTRYFEHLWGGGRHGGVTLDPPMIADGDFLGELIAMIDGARERVDFAIYFFHHGDILAALNRAHRRGVRVRGLVHDHATFALPYVRRTRASVERMRAAGITDLHFGPKHLFTHAKVVVVDEREVFLSTANWLHEDVDIHPQLSLRVAAPDLARAIVAYLTTKMQPRPPQ